MARRPPKVASVEPSTPATTKRFKILEPEIRARLVEAFATGATIEIACAYAGVGAAPYYAAMARGRRATTSRTQPGDDAFVEFVATMKAAIAKPAMRALSGIQMVAAPTLRTPDGKDVPNPNHDYRAGTWYLERRHPREFGRTIVETSQPKLIEGMTEGAQLALVTDFVVETLIQRGHGELAEEVRAVLATPVDGDE